MHLTNLYGATSSPDHYFRWNKGIDNRGKNDRIGNASCFRDRLTFTHKVLGCHRIHRNDLPPIVTHTGVMVSILTGEI